MKLHSPAFADKTEIPALYTCDGKNISVPLVWHEAPAATASFAMVADDPDASNGDWVHWVVYNIPPQVSSLPENIAKTETVDIAGFTVTQGLNSWPKTGYGGPCPPSGTHRYFFRLYALDLPPVLPARLTKHELLGKLRGHVLAEVVLLGLCARKR